MRKIELNEGWRFAKLPGQAIGNPVDAEASFEILDLPHSWYQDDDQYRGVAVYKKMVTVKPEACERVILEIGAADHTVRAVANGVELGVHKGGYSRVRFAVPEECFHSGEMELALYVENSVVDDVSPLAGDFTVFGGLYRGVNLLIANKSGFDYLYYATDGLIVRTDVDENGDGILSVEPHTVTENRQSMRIRYTLRDPEENVALELEGAADETVKGIVASPRLWDGKDDPALYTIEAEFSEGERVFDTACITCGFRRIELDAEKGFSLNGRHLKLNGVARHQDFAGCFSAVTQKEIDKDFELIGEVGANAVRLSHYQHPQYTYDKCDSEGYVVWAEIPMLKMTESSALQENAKSQLTELILQNIHHPSVCFWGVQNEIAMFRDAPFIHDNVRELAALSRSLDPGRIVTCANLNPMKAGSMLNRLTDMVGYNIYFGWYYGKMEDYGPFLDNFHAQLPMVPLGISEYGVDCAVWLHSETPLVKDYSEEFQALFHETVYPIVESKEYLWGSFIWNFCDFSSSRRDEGGQKFVNAKGLVTYDRKIKKDAFYYYKAKWSLEPFLHIREKRFVKRCRESIDVKIYTNLPEATIEGPQGTRLTVRADGNGTVVFTGMALKPGENVFTVTAETGGRAFCDQVTFERVEEPEESYILPGNEAGSTVKNWFLDEEDIDTQSYFSLKDRAEDLLENEAAHKVLQTYLPGLTVVLEKGVIPLGLTLMNILSRDTPEGVDLKELNLELMKITK